MQQFEPTRYDVARKANSQKGEQAAMHCVVRQKRTKRCFSQQCCLPLTRMEAAAAAPSTAADQCAATTAGIQVAADVVHKVLGTNIPLSQITQVRMHVHGWCKMGISFWPNFRFKSPDREEEPASVRLIYGPPPLALGSPAAAPDPPDSAGTTTTSSNSSTATATSTDDQQQQQPGCCGTRPTSAAPAAAGAQGLAAGAEPEVPRQLLHLCFTKDPPDEFNVGAKFLGSVPFPFITIRTNKLEGTLDPETGAMTLIFQASFLAQVGKREPTSLEINATLTTEPAHAFKTTLEGERLQGGKGVLVSAAEVPKTPSWFANFILWLPTAATARLPVRFEFS